MPSGVAAIIGSAPSSAAASPGSAPDGQARMAPTLAPAGKDEASSLLPGQVTFVDRSSEDSRNTTGRKASKSSGPRASEVAPAPARALVGEGLGSSSGSTSGNDSQQHETQVKGQGQGQGQVHLLEHKQDHDTSSSLSQPQAEAAVDGARASDRDGRPPREGPTEGGGTVLAGVPRPSDSRSDSGASGMGTDTQSSSQREQASAGQSYQSMEKLDGPGK